jgi:LEA14-like dessication related protein
MPANSLSPRTPLKILALLWCLLACAPALVAGCGVRQLARGEIKPPRVSLQAVTIGVPRKGTWPLSCTLLLENPNPEALSLQGYDYELWLAGKSAATGASSEPVTLPALGQATVELPILVKLPTVMGLLPSLLQRDQKLPYQIAGGFRLASLLGGFRVPFRFQGELSPREGLEHLKPYLK